MRERFDFEPAPKGPIGIERSFIKVQVIIKRRNSLCVWLPNDTRHAVRYTALLPDCTIIQHNRWKHISLALSLCSLLLFLLCYSLDLSLSSLHARHIRQHVTCCCCWCTILCNSTCILNYANKILPLCQLSLSFSEPQLCLLVYLLLLLLLLLFFRPLERERDRDKSFSFVLRRQKRKFFFFFFVHTRVQSGMNGEISRPGAHTSVEIFHQTPSSSSLLHTFPSLFFFF